MGREEVRSIDWIQSGDEEGDNKHYITLQQNGHLSIYNTDGICLGRNWEAGDEGVGNYMQMYINRTFVFVVMDTGVLEVFRVPGEVFNGVVGDGETDGPHEPVVFKMVASTQLELTPNIKLMTGVVCKDVAFVSGRGNYIIIGGKELELSLFVIDIEKLELISAVTEGEEPSSKRVKIDAEFVTLLWTGKNVCPFILCFIL